MDTATRAARPWLEHYPPGMAVDIDLAGCRTLKDLLRQGV